MNTKTEDVVKNVESNKVESTSNEQRQTVKPIVISRRRLLRAGAAGIPMVLTMAGLAPGESIKTQASAASAMMYGGNAVYNRFAGDNTIVRDGLVWTDHNGFVLKREGGVETDDFSVSADATSVELEDVNVTPWQGEGTAPVSKTFTLSVPAISAALNAYLHKTGVWYTDRKVSPSGSDLLQFLKTIQPSVLVGGATAVTDATVLFDNDNPVTFQSDESQWYNTGYDGWSLESDNSPQNYYLLPDANGNETIDVNLNLKVSFSYDALDEGDHHRTYSLSNASVTVPITLYVSGIPAQVNPGGV